MGTETIICKKCGAFIQRTIWGKIKEDVTIKGVCPEGCEGKKNES